MDRLLDALRSHDARRLAALFADDYVSVQPAHPARGFVDSAQLRLSTVPEPSSLVLLSLGLVSLWGVARARRGR